MASVVASIGIVLQNIFSVFTGIGTYLPEGTWMMLMVMLVVGIIVGTYSSVFIASPLLVFYQNWIDSRKSPMAVAAAPAPKAKATK